MNDGAACFSAKAAAGATFHPAARPAREARPIEDRPASRERETGSIASRAASRGRAIPSIAFRTASRARVAMTLQAMPDAPGALRKPLEGGEESVSSRRASESAPSQYGFGGSAAFRGAPGSAGAGGCATGTAVQVGLAGWGRGASRSMTTALAGGEGDAAGAADGPGGGEATVAAALGVERLPPDGCVRDQTKTATPAAATKTIPAAAASTYAIAPNDGAI
jgi:hypothetical protein